MNSRNEDILTGVKQIAAFLNERETHVGRLANTGQLPVFRSGRLIRARKSTLEKWIKNQEAQSIKIEKNSN